MTKRRKNRQVALEDIDPDVDLHEPLIEDVADETTELLGRRDDRRVQAGAMKTILGRHIRVEDL